jgi:hypothetical protein
MMRRSDIEAWVLRAVDQVNSRQHCEDSQVELKSKWPNPVEAARQIAGHANAAGSEPILWIIGIDESKGVVGADHVELANWLPQMKACFDQVCPDVMDLNVHVDDQTVVALLFSTDRVPFAVKNPAFGSPNGGPVQLEVPWRECRSTRSARRADLIRILAPTCRLPSIEVMGAKVVVSEPSPSCQTSHAWDVAIRLYVAPHNQDRIVIPCHRCEIGIRTDCRELTIRDGVCLEPRMGRGNDKSKLDSATITCTSTEAVIDGPGVLTMRALATTPVSGRLPQSDVDMTAALTPAGAPAPVVVEQRLRRTGENTAKGVLIQWSSGGPVH